MPLTGNIFLHDLVLFPGKANFPSETTGEAQLS